MDLDWLRFVTGVIAAVVIARLIQKPPTDRTKGRQPPPG